MTKRDDSAEKPAPQRHRGRMGCLVILGVLLLVVVGTVFAPDQGVQEAAPPTLGATSTLVRTQTRVFTRTMTATPTRTSSSEPTVSLTALPSGTPAPSRVTRAATEAADGAAPSGTSTRTPSPTASPGAQTRFATNTLFPLLIITNTPAASTD